MNKLLIAMAVAAMCATSCATITRGSSQDWTVESSPSGADVKLSTGQTCQTPCTLELPRKTSFTVEVFKAGFKTATAQVLSQISGGGATGMAGNVILGGFIGIGVDAATGAANDLKPNPLHVMLDPDDGVEMTRITPTSSVTENSKMTVETDGEVMEAVQDAAQTESAVEEVEDDAP